MSFAFIYRLIALQDCPPSPLPPRRLVMNGTSTAPLMQRTISEQLLVIVAAFTPTFLAIVIVFGIAGNLLSAYVIYATPKLRRASPNHYLAAVSISDTAFLLGLVPCT